MSSTEVTAPRERESMVAIDAGGNVGAVSAIARERYETEAAVLMAKQYPRNENRCVVRIETSCSRPSFADRATYSFPRGGSTVSGPSIHLAREVSRVWGNMDSGLRIVGEDEETVHLQGYARDLESNRREVFERRVRKLIQRKDKRTGETFWVTPDERDLLELIGREGAKLVRNAILALLPPDVVDDALVQCRKTLDRAAAGDLEKNREDTIRGICSAFARYGILVPALETRIGHSLEAITPEELTELREVWRSLKEGLLTASEAFPAASESKKASVQEALTKAAKAKATKKKPEPETAGGGDQDPPLTEEEMAAADRSLYGDEESSEDPG